MNAAEARWQLMQAECLAGAEVRTLQRTVNALQNAAPGVLDTARLALKDAELLVQRVHALRRRVEAFAPPEAA